MPDTDDISTLTPADAPPVPTKPLTASYSHDEALPPDQHRVVGSRAKTSLEEKQLQMAKRLAMGGPNQAADCYVQPVPPAPPAAARSRLAGRLLACATHRQCLVASGLSRRQRNETPWSPWY